MCLHRKRNWQQLNTCAPGVSGTYNCMLNPTAIRVFVRRIHIGLDIPLEGKLVLAGIMPKPRQVRMGLPG
jgi:hypothetical protein